MYSFSQDKSLKDNSQKLLYSLIIFENIIFRGEGYGLDILLFTCFSLNICLCLIHQFLQPYFTVSSLALLRFHATKTIFIIGANRIIDFSLLREELPGYGCLWDEVITLLMQHRNY